MIKWMQLLAASLMILLMGCAGGEPKESEEILPIAVEFAVSPQPPIQVNQAAVIQVKVTQGGESVDDAQEVQFEIWHEKAQTHQMADAEHEGNGVYSTPWIFEEPGLYYVMYHVTARDMHRMKKVEILVEGGQPQT